MFKLGRIVFGPPIAPPPQRENPLGWSVPQAYLDQSAELADRERRINEAAQILLDDAGGTPQERAEKAVVILKGLGSTGGSGS